MTECACELPWVTRAGRCHVRDVEALTAGWSWANALEPGPAAPRTGEARAKPPQPRNLNHLRLRGIETYAVTLRQEQPLNVINFNNGHQPTSGGLRPARHA
jgi:hypothetical protein